LWARGMARLDSIPDGDADYWRAFSALRRTLDRLEMRLRDTGLLREPDPMERAQAAYLAGKDADG
jgi:hypothetical protein